MHKLKWMMKSFVSVLLAKVEKMKCALKGNIRVLRITVGPIDEGERALRLRGYGWIARKNKEVERSKNLIKTKIEQKQTEEKGTHKLLVSVTQSS